MMEDLGKGTEQLGHLLARKPARQSREAALKLRQYKRTEWLQKHGCTTCVANTGLTAVQRAEIEDCFRLMDGGGSGEVDMQEVLGALHAMHISIDKTDIKAFMRDLHPQAAADGPLNYEAFSSLMTYALHKKKARQTHVQAGQVGFADAIRAFRRKKLLQSVQQGGETREQLLTMHARTQQLLSQELDALREKVKAHDMAEKYQARHAGLTCNPSSFQVAATRVDRPCSMVIDRLDATANDSVVSPGGQLHISSSSKRQQADAAEVQEAAAEGHLQQHGTEVVHVSSEAMKVVEESGREASTGKVHVGNQVASSDDHTSNAAAGAVQVLAHAQCDKAQCKSDEGPCLAEPAGLPQSKPDAGKQPATRPSTTEALLSFGHSASDASSASSSDLEADAYADNDAIARAAARRRRSVGLQRDVEAGLPTKVDAYGRVVLKWDAVNPLQAHQFGFLHAKLAHRLRAHQAERLMAADYRDDSSQHDTSLLHDALAMQRGECSRHDSAAAARHLSSQQEGRRTLQVSMATSGKGTAQLQPGQLALRGSGSSHKSVDGGSGSKGRTQYRGSNHSADDVRTRNQGSSKSIGTQAAGKQLLGATGTASTRQSWPVQQHGSAGVPQSSTVADKLDTALLEYFGQMQKRLQHEDERQDQHVKRACVAKTPGSRAGTVVNPYCAVTHSTSSRLLTPSSRHSPSAAKPASGGRVTPTGVERVAWGVRQPCKISRPQTQQSVRACKNPSLAVDQAEPQPSLHAQQQGFPQDRHVSLVTDISSPVLDSALVLDMKARGEGAGSLNLPSMAVAEHRLRSRHEGPLDAAVLSQMPSAMAYRSAAAMATVAWSAGHPEPVMTRVVIKHSNLDQESNVDQQSNVGQTQPGQPAAVGQKELDELDESNSRCAATLAQAAGCHTMCAEQNVRLSALLCEGSQLQVPEAELHGIIGALKPVSVPLPEPLAQLSRGSVGMRTCNSPSNTSNTSRPHSPPKQDPRLHGDLPSPQLWAASLRADVHTNSPTPSPPRSRGGSLAPSPYPSPPQSPPRSALRPQNTCLEPSTAAAAVDRQHNSALPQFASLLLEGANSDSKRPSVPAAAAAAAAAVLVTCCALSPPTHHPNTRPYTSPSPSPTHGLPPQSPAPYSPTPQSIQTGRATGGTGVHLQLLGPSHLQQHHSHLELCSADLGVGRVGSYGGALTALHTATPSRSNNMAVAVNAASQTRPTTTISTEDLEAMLIGPAVAQTAWSSGRMVDRPSALASTWIDVRALSPSHHGGKLRMPGHPMQPPRQDARRHQLLPSPQLWASSLRADVWASRPATSPVVSNKNARYGSSSSVQVQSRNMTADPRKSMYSISVAHNVQKLQAVMFRSGERSHQSPTALNASPSTVIHSQSHTSPLQDLHAGITPSQDLHAGITPEMAMHWHDSLDRMKLSLVRRSDNRAIGMTCGLAANNQPLRGERRRTNADQ